MGITLELSRVQARALKNLLRDYGLEDGKHRCLDDVDQELADAIMVADIECELPYDYQLHAIDENIIASAYSAGPDGRVNDCGHSIEDVYELLFLFSGEYDVPEAYNWHVDAVYSPNGPLVKVIIAEDKCDGRLIPLAVATSPTAY